MGRIIQRDKSLIPSCDVFFLEEYGEILKKTADIEGVGGHKVGFMLGLMNSLPKIVELTKSFGVNKPVIYDHQKGATDTPHMGQNFAKTMKYAGIDAVILYPLSGPATEKAWIEAAFEHGLGVIVGGLMTHSQYVRSEGGFIADEAVMETYLRAAELGVSDFGVPGSRPEAIVKIKTALEAEEVVPTFYAIGLGEQGGVISDVAKVAGNYWHAIVGRGLYKAPDIRAAALEYVSQL